MRKLAKKVVQTFDHALIKKFKRIILYLFIGLVLLDIIFVTPNKFPTISLVVYNTSPKFIIFIWLFGLFVTNVFFQRNVHRTINLTRNFLILAAVSLSFLLIGLSIKEPNAIINCQNYKTEIKNVEIPYVTRVLCQNTSKGLSETENCNCETLSCTNGVCDTNIVFKTDLTVLMKFLILLLGIILGYVLWPKVIDKNTA